MSQLVPPHGSEELRPLLLHGAARRAELTRAQSLHALALSSRERGDLVMLGIGGFTPLDGFMGQDDWRGVCDDMRMASGLFWPIPITLSCSAEDARQLQAGSEVALVDPRTDAVLATMKVTEFYSIDKEHECRTVFGTTDPGHPGVRMVMEQGEFNVAGPVTVLSEGDFEQRFPGVYMTPAQTRAVLEAKGWSRIAAFQTRNPMHRSHEHLVKTAIEVCDGVLIHSLLGNVKPGDIPAHVRSRAINALLNNYFVPDTVVHAGYPLDMRYAGPREAVLHALFRQNYGCSHLIVGRDHAGVADFYGPFDAQRIFDQIPGDTLLTRPLNMDWTFWCDRCDGMASMRTCPHGEADRLFLSGSKLRKMLSEGDDVPLQFSRAEVLEVLREYYLGLEAHERVEVVVTGHSAR